MTRFLAFPARILRRTAPAPALPPVLRGLAAYGLAEATARAVRLVSVLVVARQISPAMLGAAALTLSVFELIRVLANVGVGQRLIAAGELELPGLLRAAARLFWIVCLTVMAIQLAVAAALTWVWDQPDVGAMLAVLSFVYICMPPGLPSIFLAMRERRTAATARVSATQSVADSVLTMTLAVFWPSGWAIVLPKLLTAPVWTIMARRARCWRPDPTVPPAHLAAFGHFGPAILLSEILGAVRVNADKLIIGGLLGTKALGIYYFAFNAGLGITQSFVSATLLVVFPHLAAASPEAQLREFRVVFLQGLALLVPLVALQALLAPLYVPLIFGETWAAASQYVALLAAAALPLYAGAMLGALYRASRRPLLETRLNAAAAAAALTGLALGAQAGLGAACAGFAAGLALILIPPAVRALFAARAPSPSILQGDL